MRKMWLKKVKKYLMGPISFLAIFYVSKGFKGCFSFSKTFTKLKRKFISFPAFERVDFTPIGKSNRLKMCCLDYVSRTVLCELSGSGRCEEGKAKLQ